MSSQLEKNVFLTGIMKYYRLILVVIMLYVSITTGLFTSCNNTSTNVGYVGSKAGNQIRATYQVFNGTEKKTFRAEKGDRIEFEYTSEVIKGKLEMKMYDPEGEPVTTFKAGTTGILPLLIKKSGTYTIEIMGRETEGSFSITWRELEL